MKKIIVVFFVLVLFVSCTRSANARLARYANDIEQEWVIQDADKRIANYEWYFDQYEVIKSTALKVKMLEGKEEQGATKMVLLDMIGAYNSRSKQSMTRTQWKDDTLPYQIELKDLGVEQ